MSSFVFSQSDSWGGRPVARRITDARPRSRVVVTGTITLTSTVTIGGSVSLSSMLDDGTGEIQLIFLGRPSIPGMDVGSCWTVEGTAMSVPNRLAIWNPLYRPEFTRRLADPDERDC